MEVSAVYMKCEIKSNKMNGFSLLQTQKMPVEQTHTHKKKPNDDETFCSNGWQPSNRFKAKCAGIRRVSVAPLADSLRFEHAEIGSYFEHPINATLWPQHRCLPVCAGKTFQT